MDYFSAMEIFIKVSDTGSFSEAGRQLRMAPSSISRQIDALEEQLGATLLHRSTRKISLTEAGQIYYDRASHIVSDVEDANLSVSQMQETPRGVLKVSVPVEFGRLYITPMLADFLSTYPELHVNLTLQDERVDLLEERLDLVVRIGSLEDSTLKARKLAPNLRGIFGSPDYFTKHGIPQTHEELSERNCLLYKYRDLQSRWYLRKDGQFFEMNISGNLCVNNIGVLVQNVVNGAGLALLPLWSVINELHAGKIQQVLTDYFVTLTPSANSMIYALYPPNRHLSPKVRVFLDFLATEFQKRYAWVREH